MPFSDISGHIFGLVGGTSTSIRNSAPFIYEISSEQVYSQISGGYLRDREQSISGAQPIAMGGSGNGYTIRYQEQFIKGRI